MKINSIGLNKYKKLIKSMNITDSIIVFKKADNKQENDLNSLDIIKQYTNKENANLLILGLDKEKENVYNSLSKNIIYLDERDLENISLEKLKEIDIVIDNSKSKNISDVKKFEKYSILQNYIIHVSINFY
jgi:hypothetical protein